MGDDVLYASALAFSILVGVFFYEIQSRSTRLLVSTVVGLAITFGVCGTQIAHALIATLGTFLILRLSHVRYVAVLTFLWVFGYLFFFRLSHFAGYSLPTAPTNVIQLFLSLKLVSLAFDHADALKQRSKITGDVQTSGKGNAKTTPEERTISLYTLFAYAFCFAGLIAGPFLRFRTFDDFIERRVRVSLSARLRVAAQRGIALVICTPIYMSLYARWPLDTFRDEAMLRDASFVKLNFLLLVQFVAQRTRLYAAWRAGEIICVMSGCGAYPRQSASAPGGGPTREMELEASSMRNTHASKDDNAATAANETACKRNNTAGHARQDEMKEADASCDSDCDHDFEVDFRTVENVNIRVCETSPRVRECARAWNSCVQFWLFHYVHKRLPLSLGAFRTAITMAVSAYWHGLYAGYWMGICSMPLLMLAMDMLLRFEPAEEAGEQQAGDNEVQRSKQNWKKTLFNFALVQFRMRANEYIAVAIALLDYRDCMQFYSNVYFFWHIILIAMCLISPFVRVSNAKQRRVRTHATKAE